MRRVEGERRERGVARADENVDREGLAGGGGTDPVAGKGGGVERGGENERKTWRAERTAVGQRTLEAARIMLIAGYR